MRACFASVLFCVAGLQGADREFETVAIKPNTSGSEQVEFGRPVGNRFSARNVSLRMLVRRAYKVKDFELAGGPGWQDSSRYDITASAPGPAIGEPEFKTMLQTMLASRFQLKVHREIRSMAVYDLVPVKGGLRVEAPNRDCVDPATFRPRPETRELPCGAFFVGNGVLEGRRVSMTQVANALSDLTGRPVIEKTGYIGAFDLRLEFTFEGIAAMNGGGFSTAVLPAESTNGDAKPTIFTALQRQMGLKLESRKGSGEVLVIDRAERPDPN